MDFHAFVFWNHGLYVSRIEKKLSSKKRRRTLKNNILRYYSNPPKPAKYRHNLLALVRAIDLTGKPYITFSTYNFR